MKKYLIIATVIAAAVLSLALAQQILPDTQHKKCEEKQYPSTQNENTTEVKSQKKGLFKGVFSKLRSRTKNFLNPDDGKPAEISHLDSSSCQYSETKSGVTVHAKVLTSSQECLDELGKQGNLLVHGKKNRIFPIKMTIQNHTNQEISLQDIGTKIASKKQVANKLYGWGILKLTLLGLGVFGAATIIGCTAGIGACLLLPIKGCPCCILGPILYGASAGVFAGAIASPTTMFIYNSRSSSTRRFLGKKIKKTAPKFLETITPHETKTVMIFVRAGDYQPQFDITLDKNENSDNPLTFKIQLPEILTIKKRKKR